MAEVKDKKSKKKSQKRLTANNGHTAERYKCLCMKPERDEEMHDAWITRLRMAGEECE